MPDERRPNDDPLVHYWDEFVRGNHTPPTNLDPDAADTIHQVHTRDDAPAPDQLFVTNLWEEIMQTATRTVPLVPNIRVTPNGTASSHAHVREWPGSSFADSQRRWSAWAMAALVLAVIGGTFVAFGRPSGDGDDRAAIVATPEATQHVQEAVVDPAECQIEPRSGEEILALWYPASRTGTPGQGEKTPEMRTSLPVPLGEQADARTIEEVSATLREAAACINAGDILRFFGLLSDDFLGSLGGDGGRTFADTSYEDDRAVLEATPAPLPLDRHVKLIAITNVSIMADGRVAALLVLDDPNLTPPVQTLVTILVEERGRWVFEEFVELTGGD